MKSSEALRRARSLILSDRRIYVCHALQEVPHGAETDVANRLNVLFKGEPIENWLYDNSRRFRIWEERVFENASWRERSNELRLYRLRWIDWMIKGYEAVGD